MSNLQITRTPDGAVLINTQSNLGHRVTFKNGHEPTIERVSGLVELVRNAPVPLSGDRGKEPDTQRPKRPNLWQKATDFAKAGASRIARGSVSLPVLNHRRSVCLGVDENGEQVSKPCPSVTDHEGHQYCKTCGCPEWKLARLDGEKLKFPALACPKGRWSAMPGGG